LTDWLDASILDELDPATRDRQLDLYDPTAPNQAPYSPEFVARYREAQAARNRRITARVKDHLARLRTVGRPDDECCFVVHGTMADPRWLDPMVDPNERRPGWCYLGEPRLANMSAAGLARFCTLRGWLSQWSLDDAQVDAVDSGLRIRVPTLVLRAGADDACPPSHSDAIHAALGTDDKQHETILGANHYFSGVDGKSQLGEAAKIIDAWLDQHGFTG
jgi:pimeloyl-ACP methyl ester carboxylesterase